MMSGEVGIYFPPQNNPGYITCFVEVSILLYKTCFIKEKRPFIVVKWTHLYKTVCTEFDQMEVGPYEF
jgi:hypothetical protein